MSADLVKEMLRRKLTGTQADTHVDIADPEEPGFVVDHADVPPWIEEPDEAN